MVQEFKISPQMTKKQLIEEHEVLLEAYRDKVREAEKVRREAARAASEVETLASSREATIDGVIGSVGQLRSQVGRTLNDLTEQMTAQAEQLDGLNRAIAVQEARLAELYDIEAASGSLTAVLALYDERRAATESEFSQRLEELQQSFRGQSETFEKEHQSKVQALAEEMAAQRAAWEEERAGLKSEIEEERERLQRTRAREEEEYSYQLERSRKLNQDQFEDAKAAREKELAEKLARMEEEFRAREASLAERENELEELRQTVAEIPKAVEEGRSEAAVEARAAVTREIENDQKLEAMEHEWATRSLKDKLAFLDAQSKAKDAKLKELKADLDAALRQVHQLAGKALDRGMTPAQQPASKTPDSSPPQGAST